MMDTNMFSNDFKKYLKRICIPFTLLSKENILDMI